MSERCLSKGVGFIMKRGPLLVPEYRVSIDDGVFTGANEEEALGAIRFALSGGAGALQVGHECKHGALIPLADEGLVELNVKFIRECQQILVIRTYFCDKCETNYDDSFLVKSKYSYE